MDIQELKDQIGHLRQELHLLEKKVDADHMPSRLEHLRIELANAASHGAGAVFFLIAVPVLVGYSLQHASISYTICAAVFGFCLLITYLSSTLYHSIHHTEAKRILRIFDHVSIFFLIGGSYTPVVYRYMPHDFSEWFLPMFWAIILGGAVFKVYHTGKFRIVSTMLYVVLGFMVLFIIRPLTAHMSAATVTLIVAGGLSYALGVPFYLMKKLKYNHAIWHIFVFGGSVLHYFAVLNSVTVP